MCANVAIDKSSYGKRVMMAGLFLSFKGGSEAIMLDWDLIQCFWFQWFINAE